MADHPTLGELIAKVGGRINDAGYVEFGSEMAVRALVLHALAAAKAVPREPTPEMLEAVKFKAHPTRPNGWADRHATMWRKMWDAATAPSGDGK